ncbi:MAG TPA: hypothetical protein VGR82_17700 [Methylomirabilota bacterium]|jgi:hypothetical protein|nr:hypothetical protein [Methylomirabilota bacterium]
MSIDTIRRNHPHGTAARYVTGCRCEACRAANRAAAQRRADRAVSIAQHVIVSEGGPAPQLWTAPGGHVKTRVYARACPGVNGAPCRWKRHLRKDSKGGVCGDCRLQLPEVWNGIVSSAPARAHILALATKGIGWKSIAAVASVAQSILWGVRQGTRPRMRAQALRRVVDVTVDAARSDGHLVAKGATLRHLRRLRDEGYAAVHLARKLGAGPKTTGLQIGKRPRITARTAMKVEQLFQRECGEL